MVLQLSDTKVYPVSVDSINWIEGRVRQEKIIMSLCVDNYVKSWSHIRGANNTEGDGVTEDIRGNLSARVEDEILGYNDPVKMLQGKIGLYMEYNILTNIDSFCGAMNKDVMVFWGIGCPSNCLSNDLSVQLYHVKICNHFQLFHIFRNIKLEQKKFSFPFI